MSTDRLERRLPEVLTELSLPAMPDYIDNLLSRTERMSQRPRWSLLERWFPVSTLDATFAPRRTSLPRLLLVVAAVLLAVVVAALAWYVGAPKPLPAPYGLAANGVIVATTSQGDVVVVDPTTNTLRTVVAGEHAIGTDVAPSGQRFAYLRNDPQRDQAIALVVANLDGSVVREFPAEAVINFDWFEWSPESDRILIAHNTHAVIADVATGTITQIDVPYDVRRAQWIGTTGDILLTSVISEGGTTGATMRIERLAAGTLSKPAPMTQLHFAVDPPLVSPDGSKFLYFIWGNTDNLHGRLHVYDFATGQDLEVSPPEAPGSYHLREWEGPVWSPDGTSIAADVYTSGENHVGIIPAAGGEPIFVGPSFPTGTGGVYKAFSPDGKSLLVKYLNDGATWLLPVSGAPGQQVSWDTNDDMDWQRRAP